MGLLIIGMLVLYISTREPTTKESSDFPTARMNLSSLETRKTSKPQDKESDGVSFH
jgi:hypothetical protein